MAIERFLKWRPSAILDLRNSKFLTVGAVKRPILQQRTKFRKNRSNRCRDITIFVIFKMAAAATLNFQKIEILTAFPLSLCQISSKSVKLLQTYGDLTVFKMAAVRHLGFVKFEIFNGRNG